jgi:glycine betaine transporter
VGFANTSLSLFGFYYSLLGLLAFCFLIFVALSSLGRHKIGGTHAVTHHSRIAWLTMLFSTGMGAGLLLRAVQEPLYYYQNSLQGMNSQVDALKMTFYHWGFTPWTFYALFGLFFSFLGSGPHLSFSWPAKWLVIFSTLLGLISAIPLGSVQVLNGLNHVYKMSAPSEISILVALLIVVISWFSAVSGLKKGLRILSHINVALACFLMVWIFMVGNPIETTLLFLKSFLAYSRDFFSLSLNIGSQKSDQNFLISWTYFYWAFWLSWAPFTGLFIAKISRGRSLREFVLFVLLIPSTATFLWFSVFASNAFLLEKKNLEMLQSIYNSVFIFLEAYRFHGVLQTIALVNVVTFLITSLDSALVVLADLIDLEGVNQYKKIVFIFASFIFLSCFFLLLINSENLLNVISQSLILLAMPVSLWGAYCLWRLLQVFKKL